MKMSQVCKGAVAVGAVRSSEETPQSVGTERRRRRVYVTRNTEYHFDDTCCVAVRDRRTGEFLPGHLALQRQLRGGIRFFGNGGIVPNPGRPEPGEALYFAADGRDLVTSLVVKVERPEKRLVAAYPPPVQSPGRHEPSPR